MDESKRMKILVDMDQSLIDAVHEDDHNYHISNGKEVSYTITYIDNIGLKITNSHRVRVSIRPYAIDMVKNIVKYGHIYILWSAGLYEYVHAVMNYFIEASGVRPEFIYTRRDMISYENSIYKSMVSKGYKIDEILIIEDNRNLIHPEERSRVIDVSPWFTGNLSDKDMNYVIQSIIIYSDENYVSKKDTPRSFILSSSQI